MLALQSPHETKVKKGFKKYERQQPSGISVLSYVSQEQKKNKNGCHKKKLLEEFGGYSQYLDYKVITPLLDSGQLYEPHVDYVRTRT